jgi:hypothetical protein
MAAHPVLRPHILFIGLVEDCFSRYSGPTGKPDPERRE